MARSKRCIRAKKPQFSRKALPAVCGVNLSQLLLKSTALLIGISSGCKKLHRGAVKRPRRKPADSRCQARGENTAGLSAMPLSSDAFPDSGNMKRINILSFSFCSRFFLYTLLWHRAPYVLWMHRGFISLYSNAPLLPFYNTAAKSLLPRHGEFCLPILNSDIVQPKECSYLNKFKINIPRQRAQWDKKYFRGTAAAPLRFLKTMRWSQFFHMRA